MVKVTPTSRDTAEVDGIVLRSTTTTRLLFRAQLVNNKRDASAPVKGSFIFQRKTPGGEWDDISDFTLAQFKAGEGAKWNLNAAEMKLLHEHLTDLIEFFQNEGIPTTEVQYVPEDRSLVSVLELSDDQLSKLASADEAFQRLLRWATKQSDLGVLVDRFESLSEAGIQNLHAAVGLASIRSALDDWVINQENSNEEFWQSELAKRSYVLSNLFHFPIVVIKEKAYVGGKSFDNTGGSIVDFLGKNQVTGNAVLIEIKTPVTRLLGSAYRTNVYNVSADLSGAVQQVLHYRHSIIHGGSDLSRGVFETTSPHCFVIIGNASAELDNEFKRASFEAFRNELHGVRVITYDEMFERARGLIELASMPAE